ncbi:MAG: LamG domain-containing protein [Actinomycetota bacterium]
MPDVYGVAAANPLDPRLVLADWPQCLVEIGFSANPLDALSTIVWTDVSNRVWEYGYTRGKQQELGRYEAGTATVLLDNLDRALDPTNTASPYYPNVLPMRRIRISLVYQNIQYRRFTGYINAWDQKFDQQNQQAWVELHCTDAFELLNLANLTSIYQTTVLADTPTGYWRLGDTAGPVASDSSGNANHATYVGGINYNQTGLIGADPNGAAGFDGNTSYVTVPAQALVASGPFSVEMWFQTGGSGNNYYLFSQNGQFNTGPILSLITAIGGASGILFIEWDVSSAGDHNPGAGFDGIKRLNDGLAHHVVATLTSDGFIHVYVDGALVGTSSHALTNLVFSGTTATIGAAVGGNYVNQVMVGAIDEVAYYNYALTQAQVTAHFNAGTAPWKGDASGARIGRILDQAGWPSADRNLATGDSILQQAPALDGQGALQTIQLTTDSELGSFYMSADGLATFDNRRLHMNQTSSLATFGDGPGEHHYTSVVPTYDTSELWTGATVQRVGGQPQTVTDAAASTTYGTWTNSLSGLQTQSDQECLDAANWIVRMFKTPKLRLAQIDFEASGYASGDSQGAIWPALLAREINRDRITVNRRPPGGGPMISQLSYIARMTESYTNKDGKGPMYHTSWYVAPIDATGYFQLDTTGHDELDTNTVLCF